MNLRLFGIGIFLTLAILACSTGAPSAPTISPAEQTPRNLSTVKPAESTPTATPSLAPDTATPVPLTPDTLTPDTLTIPPCPASDDYAWSHAYQPELGYIHQILPSGDGNFYLTGGLRRKSGLWLAKLAPDGRLLWQGIYGADDVQMQVNASGNLILTGTYTAREINPQGELVRELNQRGALNPDGGFTIISGSQAARYDKAQVPLWQFSAKDLDAFGEITSDGGAMFAYAGQYADTSHYMRPIYTDLKVIRITASGDVLQAVYGKLVGHETLDFMRATRDGGALLAGAHTYEELGLDYDIWLMKLNASGGISWQSTLKLAPEPEWIRQIIFLENGYLVETEVNYSGTPTLIHLKPNGSLNWQKVISSARGPVVINTAASAPDGGLLLAGQTGEKNSLYWLARLDPKGNLVWEKTLGCANLPGETRTEVLAILPLPGGQILLGGATDLVGGQPTGKSSAWLANIRDSGEKLGLLQLSPARFSVTTTLGRRPATLPDEISQTASLTLALATPQPPIQTDEQPLPACLPARVVFPTPAALPTLTPSVTPTPSFARDLYLSDPPMQGDDVLLLQQRLFELGYTEVGAPDGVFGKMTREAVVRFQQNNKLDVDGYVGPKTWRKLFSPDAKKAQ
jgi:hypothetical protein